MVSKVTVSELTPDELATLMGVFAPRPVVHDADFYLARANKILEGEDDKAALDSLG